MYNIINLSAEENPYKKTHDIFIFFFFYILRIVLNNDAIITAYLCPHSAKLALVAVKNDSTNK